MAAVQPEAALNASSSWILLDTLFCNIFTKSFHWLPLLIPLPHSTPYSTQCETTITTTILLKLNKIMTQQIFLPPPMIHLLLLDYVKENCTLTTAQGLNLKKLGFNKVHKIVKSKDMSQCHYKWGHVCIILINKSSHNLSRFSSF